MSTTGTRLDLDDAAAIAEATVHLIDGEAHVVGSVRRRRPTVGDIEIMVHRDATLRLRAEAGPLYPGEYRTMKGGGKDWGYWQLRHVKCGYVVDLFRFDDDNRGSIMLIRTGPADFSRQFVMSLPRHGMKHDGGYVRDEHGEIVSCPTERRAFEYAGIPWLEPHRREA